MICSYSQISQYLTCLRPTADEPLLITKHFLGSFLTFSVQKYVVMRGKGIGKKCAIGEENTNPAR